MENLPVVFALVVDEIPTADAPEREIAYREFLLSEPPGNPEAAAIYLHTPEDCELRPKDAAYVQVIERTTTQDQNDPPDSLDLDEDPEQVSYFWTVAITSSRCQRCKCRRDCLPGIRGEQMEP